MSCCPPSSGLHERYSLARAQTGFPVIVSVVAKLDYDSQVDFTSRLEKRIDTLLANFPLLSAGVTDDRCSRPRFYRSGDANSFTSSRVLLTREYEGCKGDNNDDDRREVASILASELSECGEGGDALSALRGPMWRVVMRYHSTKRHCWLSLSINHVMTDGRGTANLFQLLLQDDITKYLPPTPLLDLPPTSDAVFNMSPSLRFLVPVVWKELVLPRLPTFIRVRLQETPSWPGNRPLAASPHASAPLLDVLLLDGDTVRNLKSTATSRGIKTITPLIHTAALVAVYSMAGQERGLSFSSGTPMSTRNQAGPDATFVTGNYVSMASWHATPCPSTAIWPLARHYASLLTSSVVRQEGNWTFGMLSYIPDTMKDPQASNEIAQYFFSTKMTSDTPYSNSFSLSNLGLIDAAGVKARYVAWAQSASPIGAPFTIDVCGYGGKTAYGEAAKEETTPPYGGLSISIGTRKGVADGDTFADCLQRVIAVLAKSQQVHEETTIEELLQRIKV
jgi:hypothetical protein